MESSTELDVFGFQLHWRIKRMRFMLYNIGVDDSRKHS